MCVPPCLAAACMLAVCGGGTHAYEHRCAGGRCRAAAAAPKWLACLCRVQDGVQLECATSRAHAVDSSFQPAAHFRPIIDSVFDQLNER